MPGYRQIRGIARMTRWPRRGVIVHEELKIAADQEEVEQLLMHGLKASDGCAGLGIADFESKIDVARRAWARAVRATDRAGTRPDREFPAPASCRIEGTCRDRRNGCPYPSGRRSRAGRRESRGVSARWQRATNSRRRAAAIAMRRTRRDDSVTRRRYSTGDRGRGVTAHGEIIPIYAKCDFDSCAWPR